jgi:hypothetical protein
MFSQDFYLLTAHFLYSCYIVSRFMEEFEECANFRGVLIAEKKPSESVLEGRKRFHAEYGGKKEWTDEMEQKWLEFYPPLNESIALIWGSTTPEASAYNTPTTSGAYMATSNA